MQDLIDSFYNCPTIMKGNYPYFVHPLTDGALPIEPKLLKNTSQYILNQIYDTCKNTNIDLILAPEAMALPIATLIAMELNVPWVIIRKRQYNLPGEIQILQQTGYSKNNMYINSVTPGNNVIIIDDIVSTGGTLKAIIDVLHTLDVNVLGSYVIAEKNNATKYLQQEGYNINALINITMGKDCIDSVEPKSI